MTSPKILCPCLDRQESSLINSGAFIDLTLNQIRILGIWLTSWAWCHSPTSCWDDHCHWRLSLPMRGCTWSARVFAWLVCVKWPEHYIVMRQSMLFTSGTSFCGHELYLWVWGHAGKLPPQLGGELLPQAKEFKYLRVLFSNRRVECEMDRWFGVLQALHWTVLVKRELSKKEKLLDWTAYVHSNPHLEPWAVGSDQNNGIADKCGQMSFLQGVAGLSQALTSKGARWGSSVICLECLLEVFQAQPTGRRA